tara:strand:- start:1346 stop:1762 length:417 start_codon:yes stop_codon:yes gene_type:complete
MLNRILTKKTLMIVAVAVLLYIVVSMQGKKSGFEAEIVEEEAAAPSEKNAMRPGSGLASALLPREVSQGEDFGEFAPSDLLADQSFLDPRSQVGFPETVGGALRNANQQVRSEPPNPKQSYVWNNSTITATDQKRALE